MWWLFKKKPKPEKDSVVKERWVSNFSLFDQKRFSLEEGDDYSSYEKGGALELQLKKKSLFAWTYDEFYRYDDFILESSLEFAPENGHSAVGFIFRCSNDSNFYYFLISNQGAYRLDVVFNGNPMVLIDWTASSTIQPDKNLVRIVTRGSHFSFYIDNEWVGEYNDSTLQSGFIALAGQNFDEKDEACFNMQKFSIESRPIEVEAGYFRWTDYVPIPPDSRINLAKTHYNSRKYNEAVYQLRMALKTMKPSGEVTFLLADSLFRLELFEPALNMIDQALKLEPAKKEYLVEKANILYMQNNYLVLKDYLKELDPEVFENNPVLWNIFGHTEYSLGNWEDSFNYYNNAIQLDDTLPFYYMNAARSLERMHDTDRCIEYYMKASRLLFRQEGYDDLYRILRRVEDLGAESSEISSFKGKMLFHEGEMEKAEALFHDLILKGYKESSVYFLYGMILTGKGLRQEGVEYILRAIDFESEYYLYWFRLAENYLFLEEPQKARPALKKALELAPQDPWVLNLAGEYYLAEKEYDTSKKYLEKAVGIHPDAPEIGINLSETYFQAGDTIQAYDILEKYEENSLVHNQRGNFYTKEDKLEDAFREYEKALKIDPNNSDIIENCMSVCMRLEYFSRSEELAVALLDRNPSVRVYELVGRLAAKKGEFARAEVAYIEGIRIDPADVAIRVDLAQLHFNRLKFDKAQEVLKDLAAKGITDPQWRSRVENLLERIRREVEIDLECAECRREWSVPKNIGPQGALRIYGMPPEESPAGKCPECGSIYCIACGTQYLQDQRFMCPRCDVSLKLSDDYLKYLVNKFVSQSEGSSQKE